jgi:two-component system, chemotaxis family, response regulator Rcp1
MASGSKVGVEEARSPVRIMVVEDNDGDVFLLEKALEDLHFPYEIIRHEDGEQAIHALSQHGIATPDLILVDLNLPRREGYEVIRAIRGVPSLVGVPIGVLTSSNAAKDRHRASLIGIERYIHKPPTLEEFLVQVGKAVEELLTLSPARPSTGL